MRRRLLRLLPISALLSVISLAIWSNFCALSEVPAATGWGRTYGWRLDYDSCAPAVDFSSYWPASTYPLMDHAVWLYVLKAVCDHGLQWISAAFLVLLSIDFALSKLRQATPRLFSILHKYCFLGGAVLMVSSIAVSAWLMYCQPFHWTWYGVVWLGSLPVSIAVTLVIMGAVIIHNLLGHCHIGRSDPLKCMIQIIRSVGAMRPWRRAIVAVLLIAFACSVGASIGCECSVPLVEQQFTADLIGEYARGRTSFEIITKFGYPQTIEKVSADGRCLVDEPVNPWQKLPTDSVKWIYMTGSSTCEMLTMKHGKCMIAKRCRI